MTSLVSSLLLRILRNYFKLYIWVIGNYSYSIIISCFIDGVFGV
jgi:hypothetical protein